MLHNFMHLFGHDFLVSFWSNLIADILVAGFVGFVVYEYSNLFIYPNLLLVVKQNGYYRNTILLSDDAKGNYIASFQFAIKNIGSKTLKNGEGYWHIYVNTVTPTPFDVPGEENHKRQQIPYVIYPGYFVDLDLIYNLRIKKDDVENSKIPYFFVTEYGYFPKTAKIDQNTGTLRVKDMGFLDFELPKAK